MLENWLVEEEKRLTNAVGEFTEVMLALGEGLADMLINEFIEEMEDIEWFG